MSRRGRFITIEGGEGAGKSTQLARLGDWLRARGVTVIITREPGGSPLAETLREILLSGRVAPFGAEAEAIFFAVARADHMATTIRPALQAGTWVICDRFIDSTWAYQGTAGASKDLLARLDAVAVGNDRPDLTVILDLPYGAAAPRLSARGGSADRFEKDVAEVQEARRRAFLAIAEREPGRCVVVDASLEPSAIGDLVAAAVVERLGPVGEAQA